MSPELPTGQFVVAWQPVFLVQTGPVVLQVAFVDTQVPSGQYIIGNDYVATQT